MIRDVMDILNPHEENTATATYYPTRTNDPAIGGQKISYKYVDPRSRVYRHLFPNLQMFDGDNVAISTKDRLDYKVGGFIVTADGAYYQIDERAVDYSTASKQALRLFKTPLGTSFVLRMHSVDNPWGRT